MDRYQRRLGDWEFDDKYLQALVVLRVFGFRVASWWKDVRVVPVHEWARTAFGDFTGYPDEYPAERLNR